MKQEDGQRAESGQVNLQNLVSKHWTLVFLTERPCGTVVQYSGAVHCVAPNGTLYR